MAHTPHHRSAAPGARRDRQAEVTARIVAALEAGTSPWRKPWDERATPARPRSRATPLPAARYRGGVNHLVFATSPLALESGDPRWATHAQAAAQGWQVRRGEQGTTAFLYRPAQGRDAGCDRDLSGRFGSEAYSREEVRAELAQAMVCAELGLAECEVDNAAAYLASWLAVLRANPHELIRAAADAQRAADWLLVHHPEHARRLSAPPTSHRGIELRSMVEERRDGEMGHGEADAVPGYDLPHAGYVRMWRARHTSGCAVHKRACAGSGKA